MTTQKSSETPEVGETYHYEIAHTEFDHEKQHAALDSNLHGFVADADMIPPGYYFSLYFLGSVSAIGISLLAGIAGFGFPAPILNVIDADIGPSPYLSWAVIVYTLGIAVGLTLVGRLSDIFGRRYFFIGGAVLGTVGSIVCARAQSINTLIGGMTMIGVAASTQLSYTFAMAELVPMRARFWTASVIYTFTIPAGGFGPAIAQGFVNHHSSVGWRGVYYLLIAINVVALALWSIFYWPPTFTSKHEDARLSDFIKNFDYPGTLLYTAGLILLLLGISMGGNAIFPWKSAQTLATLLVGSACLIGLGFWVWFANPKEPLIPKHIIQQLGFMACAMVLGLAAGVYYAFNVVWPMMVNVLYSDGDAVYGGWLACVFSSCFLLGQITGGLLCRAIGKVRYQMIATMIIGGTLLACMATCGPNNKDRALGLVAGASIMVGWIEGVCNTMLTITINDQQEIGTAAGIGGSIRTGTATICQTIYTVILNSRLRETIPAQVPRAAIEAGLPAPDVASLLQAITVGIPAAFSTVPNITPSILAAATAAYKEASADAYRTVFLCTIAFSGLAVIFSFFTPNVDDLMTAHIAATLSKVGGQMVNVEVQYDKEIAVEAQAAHQE